MMKALSGLRNMSFVFVIFDAIKSLDFPHMTIKQDLSSVVDMWVT